MPADHGDAVTPSTIEGGELTYLAGGIAMRTRYSRTSIPPVALNGDRESRRLNWAVLEAAVIVAAALAPALLTSSAQADEITAAQENGGKLASKTGNLDPKVFDPKNATGTATTTFGFHPPAPVTSTYTKNVKTNVVNPNPFTHNYPGGEVHGTTGSATYNVSIGKVVEGAKSKFTIGAKVEGKIQPGNNKNVKVTIDADVKDPFNFSNNPDAQFDVHPEGLDYSFSLRAGTAFPAVFAPDLQSFGAVAADTSMHFAARVAPGFVTNATSFWGPTQPGSIDLFELIITSDAAHVINAALTFGATSPGFTLNFQDQSGMSFDPTSPSDVSAIESLIESSFSNGVVTSNLEDAFTVGFVPGAAIGEYTFGTAATLDFGAVEVIPEPSTYTWVMLGAGILVLLGYRSTGRMPTLTLGLRRDPTIRDRA